MRGGRGKAGLTGRPPAPGDRVGTALSLGVVEETGSEGVRGVRGTRVGLRGCDAGSLGVRGSVEWNHELFGCGAEARGVGFPESTEFLSSLLVHVLIHSPGVPQELLPLTTRGAGAAPRPVEVRRRCTDLWVWRQVWLRGAELRWAQRGSDPENGSGGDELGFEVGTSQGRGATASGEWVPGTEPRGGVPEGECDGPRCPPEPGWHSAERWWPCYGFILTSHHKGCMWVSGAPSG